MKFREALQLFKENVVGGTMDAPDRYPDWDTGGWPLHRSELLRFWAITRAGITRDTEHAAVIDSKLEQAIACFDRGEREPGQKLMVQIYNVLNLNTLR